MYLISLQSYGFVFTLQNMLGIILFAHAECVLPCGACLVEKNKKKTEAVRSHFVLMPLWLRCWLRKTSFPRQHHNHICSGYATTNRLER
jgi:hypothetical protein